MPLARPTRLPSDDHLRLRPLADSDEHGLATLVADRDVRRFTRVPDPPPPGFARDWLDGYLEHWRTGTRAGFAVEGLDGDWLGFACLIGYDEAGAEGELGYIVAPDARGRGVARRTLRLLSAWALGEAGLYRAQLIIDPANHASLRVAERAGFVLEGTRRGTSVGPGVHRDVTVWSRLRTDGNP